jgi:uncharacterized membrane protein YbjE (DUF340 family)
VEFDPYLYVAFLVGLAAGRLVRPRTAWVGRATLVTVGVLVGLLGASLDAVPGDRLVETIPFSLGFAALVLALTAGTYLLIARRAVRSPAAQTDAPPKDRRLPLSLLLLGALVGGYGVGRAVTLPTSLAIPWALYALLALVAFDLKLRPEALKHLWVPLSAASIGAVAAGAIFALVTGTPYAVGLATTLAFGWYTLAGPLVGARAGAVLGLLAFLTNFLREDLTMLLAPIVGRRLGGEGMTALGGATSMDTTLYFVTRYGDAEAGSLALASGLVLTIAASLILPAVLALP